MGNLTSKDPKEIHNLDSLTDIIKDLETTVENSNYDKYNQKHAKSQLDVTESQLEIAKYQLNSTEYQLKIAKYQLKIAKSQLNTTESQLEIAKYQLNAIHIKSGANKISQNFQQYNLPKGILTSDQIPGVGNTAVNKLINVGISTFDQLYGQFFLCDRDEVDFIMFLEDLGIDNRWAREITKNMLYKFNM
jgi:hypothetical protein